MIMYLIRFLFGGTKFFWTACVVVLGLHVVYYDVWRGVVVDKETYKFLLGILAHVSAYQVVQAVAKSNPTVFTDAINKIKNVVKK